MTRMIRCFFAFLSILIFVIALGSMSVFAATRTDIELSVTSNISSGSDIAIGEQLEFTLNVANNSEENESVVLKNNYDNWTQTITVPAGDSRQTTMDYVLPNTVPGGTTLQFDFFGSVEDDNISFENDMEGYKFEYDVEEKYELYFDAQMRRNQDTKLGSTIQYDITVTNTGNMEARDIKIEQGLDVQDYITINSLIPGATRTEIMRYKIPNNTQVGRDIANTFSLTASEFERQVRDTYFYVDEEKDRLSISLALAPVKYSSGDRIDIVVTLKSSSNRYMEDLEIRQNNSSSTSKKVSYLGAGNSTTVRFEYDVPDSDNTEYFYVYDEHGDLLAEDYISIRPSEPYASASTPTTEPASVPDTISTTDPISTPVLTPVSEGSDLWAQPGSWSDISSEASATDSLTNQAEHTETQSIIIPDSSDKMTVALPKTAQPGSVVPFAITIGVVAIVGLGMLFVMLKRHGSLK